jgi:hypothetical protein
VLLAFAAVSLSLLAQQDAPAAAPQKIIRVAVMDLKLSDDVPARTGRIVADNLVAEIRKLQGVTVVSMDELRAMLDVEAQRQTLGCSENDSCLAEITEALGADVIVTGSVAGIDGARVLSLRRVAQAQAQVTGTVEERLVPAQGEELLAAVGPSVEKLFPELKLRPGMVRGVPAEKALLLNPPPLPVWSTIAVGAVAAVAGASAIGFGVAAQSEADAAQKEVDGSAAAAIPGSGVVDAQTRVDSLALAANVMYVAAGAAAVATGVMLFFTDWTGARGE